MSLHKNTSQDMVASLTAKNTAVSSLSKKHDSILNFFQKMELKGAISDNNMVSHFEL